MCGLPAVGEKFVNSRHRVGVYSLQNIFEIFPGVDFEFTAGCAKCHPQPLYSDLKDHDVGVGIGRDKDRRFDTPTLVELWRTAPYLYDGRAEIIKEVLTKFVESGWEFGGHADAAAKAGESGAEASGEGAIGPIKVYAMTESGLALQATVTGTKYWKDKSLN